MQTQWLILLSGSSGVSMSGWGSRRLARGRSAKERLGWGRKYAEMVAIGAVHEGREPFGGRELFRAMRGAS